MVALVAEVEAEGVVAQVEQVAEAVVAVMAQYLSGLGKSEVI